MNRLNPCIILANKMAIPLAFSTYLVPKPNIESGTHTFVFGTRTLEVSDLKQQKIFSLIVAKDLKNNRTGYTTVQLSNA